MHLFRLKTCSAADARPALFPDLYRAAPSWAMALAALACLCTQALQAVPMVPTLATDALPNAASAQLDAVERFQASADRRARHYDRAQDIEPRQLLALIEVAERTDYSLGQLLATGEHESAHTWNDFVRPPLGGGRLGSAAGVWQFQPRTFERIIHLYGDDLLALTEADPAAGRRRLDLGFGPFCDGHVRLIIRDTVDGLRDPDDQELKLLRHNTLVLAFSKYLLSRDSGATDPVEDYLFHFLGPAQGRRILTYARGSARHTRTVKPPPPSQPNRAAQASGSAPTPAGRLPARPEELLKLAPRGYLQPGSRSSDAMLRRPGQAAPRVSNSPSAPLMRLVPPSLTGQTPNWQAPHGYAHDSAVVRGNSGMFYRDGEGRSDPYTWAEFLQHIANRVKADQQPRLVRAKYGVGFHLKGGDMPRWAFDPANPGEDLDLRLADGRHLPMPKAQLTEPLTLPEMRDYQRRLLALVNLWPGPEAKDRLSDAAALALRRLGLLDVESRVGTGDGAGLAHPDPIRALAVDMGPGFGHQLRTTTPEVQDALHAFRDLVGKAPPDDPTQVDLVLPAEHAAMEVYGARIARFIAAERTRVGAAEVQLD